MVKLTELGDPELLRRASQDDSDAFSEYVDRYFSVLTGCLVKYTGNYQDAEDCASETFAKLWKMRNRFNEIDSIKNYTIKAAINNLNMKTRIKKNNKRIHVEFKEGHVGLETRNPSTILEKNETVNELEEMLEDLPEEKQETFRYIRVERNHYEEGAERFGESVTAIKSRVCRVRKYLREKISNEPDLCIYLN